LYQIVGIVKSKWLVRVWPSQAIQTMYVKSSFLPLGW
jgi:hypothetical protein